ncbi:MAG: chaperonin GroEL [Chlamydiales bacterium]|nr:chaperonin GroEL [Chlamydiales bacterium]
MTAKEIIFEEEARGKLLKGIVKITDAIGCTLGPRGRNVGLEKGWGAPVIINDGHTIVRDISFEDQYENMGASMVKEVAGKLKETCGDGTTTASLILRAIVQNGVKFISSGASPINLKRGMEKALEAILKSLTASAIPIKNQAETLAIATVAASGNQEIGKFISDAIQKVGKSGVVTIEEGKGTETTVELVEGMQFDRGYVSAYFCTNNDTMTIEMENAKFLIIDKKIASIQELLPILQSVAASGASLVIIAEEIEGDALATLVVNRLRGSLKVAAVKAPGFGDRRKAILQDIAALTGATVITEDAGIALKDATAEVLGSADKIKINKDTTTIVNGHGKQEAINARIKQIEIEANNTTSSYDKEKLEERKAKLSGGVAVIKVGAPTEPEMKQKKQMFEDSLNSTKAALEEGIVPGGGVALLRASKAAESLKLQGDEELGLKIVIKACETPVKQIIENAGFDGAVLLNDVREAPTTHGFNALTEKVEDLLAAHVIDACKVLKSCITHAVSVAGIILISEALIGDAPDDEAKQ